MTSNISSGATSNRPERKAGSGQTSKYVRFTDAEVAQANERLDLAFTLLGLYSEGHLVCPECGNYKKKTVAFKQSKSGGYYWKCYPCGAHSSATKLLTDKGGRTFVEAVNILLGRDANAKDMHMDVPVIQIAPPFEAVVDVEVYEHIRNSGSVKAAQLYWSTWHLGPKAVEAAGSVMVGEERSSLELLLTPVGSSEHNKAWGAHKNAVAKMHKSLVESFGMERLKACGVVTETEKGEDFFLINAEYPVIEAHEHPNGKIVGMQFRPVGRAKVKVDAHKAWKRKWSPIAKEKWPDDPTKSSNDAWKAAYAEDPRAAGEQHKYVTPFLSLKGAGVDSLVGCGLRRLAALPDNTPVYIVEGFKDHLAVRTMLAESYAMPGTGNLPPEKVCGALKRLDVVVALDGDAAGEKGRKALLEHFKENGVAARIKTGIREGMDVTDVLVERVAHTGCECNTCVTWRSEHPADPKTCVCASCKAWRDKHPETKGCKCLACLARGARHASEELVRSVKEQLVQKV